MPVMTQEEKEAAVQLALNPSAHKMAEFRAILPKFLDFLKNQPGEEVWVLMNLNFLTHLSATLSRIMRGSQIRRDSQGVIQGEPPIQRHWARINRQILMDPGMAPDFALMVWKDIQDDAFNAAAKAHNAAIEAGKSKEVPMQYRKVRTCRLPGGRKVRAIEIATRDQYHQAQAVEAAQSAAVPHYRQPGTVPSSPNPESSFAIPEAPAPA